MIIYFINILEVSLHVDEGHLRETSLKQFVFTS